MLAGMANNSGRYWAEVHKRALAATRKSLGLESWGQIMLRALAAIAVVSALVLWGSDDAARDEIIFRTVGVSLVVGLFPFLYAWNFISVPPTIADSGSYIMSDRPAHSSEGEIEVTPEMVEAGADELRSIGEDGFVYSDKRDIARWVFMAMIALRSK